MLTLYINALTSLDIFDEIHTAGERVKQLDFGYPCIAGVLLVLQSARFTTNAYLIFPAMARLGIPPLRGFFSFSNVPVSPLSTSGPTHLTPPGVPGFGV